MQAGAEAPCAALPQLEFTTRSMAHAEGSSKRRDDVIDLLFRRPPCPDEARHALKHTVMVSGRHER